MYPPDVRYNIILPGFELRLTLYSKIYGSYDPNVGLFVCTSWIIVMEEFQHLLDSDLANLMKESMYNATVGDGYRVGGVDMDNCE